MKRLDCIASFIPNDAIVADIGTDHAYLPIQLVSTGKIQRAYACDITEGPLSIAKEHIHQMHYEDCIETILSNGFENVPDDVDTAVIAGMGCRTILTILENAYDRLPVLKSIIVQSNNDVDVLRKWISDHNCTIMNEGVVYEKGHDYVIMQFCFEPHASYTEQELILGPVLMQTNTIAFQEYCQRMYDKTCFILERRKKTDPTYVDLLLRKDLYNQYRIKKEDK